MWEKFGVRKIGEFGKKKDIHQLFTCQLLLYNQFCLYMQLICQYFTSIGSDYTYIASPFPNVIPHQTFPTYDIWLSILKHDTTSVIVAGLNCNTMPMVYRQIHTVVILEIVEVASY